MAHAVAETTLIPRPPKGREEPPVQISRLLHAHEIVIKEARAMARRAADAGDDGTNDLIVSDVIRRNELQAWFVAEHDVDTPLVRARVIRARHTSATVRGRAVVPSKSVKPYAIASRAAANAFPVWRSTAGS